MKEYNEAEEIRLLEADELVEKGNIEEAESFYDEAMVYYNQAIDIYKDLEHAKGIISILRQLALILRRKGNNQESLEYLENAIQIANTNRFYKIKSVLYCDQGTIYGKSNGNIYREYKGNIHTYL